MRYKYFRTELLDILIKKIKDNKFHENHDHAVIHAKWCRQIMTGDDHREMLVRYKEKETQKQQDRRVSLYNSRTAYVSNKILSSFLEVERSDSIVSNLYYKDNTDSNTLINRLSDFNDSQSLVKYMHEAGRRLNFFDPNSFIAIEFKYLEPLKKPYAFPIEVYSKMVYDYEFENGRVQYLISKVDITLKDQDGKDVPGSKFTLYGPLYSYVLTQTLDSFDAISIGDKYFQVNEVNTKFNSVPVIRVGYIKNPSNWETFVSPMYAAKHILTDLINTKSEYDLHKSLHGFLQKFAYVEKCNYRTESNDSCNAGKLKISGSECPSCKGTGKIMHTSVQDVVYVPLPEDGTPQTIPLRDFVHYVEVPEHMIKSMKEDIISLEKDIALAIFNKDTFSRSEISFTATEVRLNEQSVHNVLADFADNISRLITEGTNLVADMLGDLDKLVFQYKIGKDFKLLGLDELIELRRRAIDAKAPYDVISQIDIDILAKQNQGNPKLVDQIKAEENHKPFKHLPSEMVAFALAELQPTDPDRILYFYFDKIFTNIWAKFPNFEILNLDVQKKAINSEIDSIIKLKYEQVQQEAEPMDQ